MFKVDLSPRAVFDAKIATVGQLEKYLMHDWRFSSVHVIAQEGSAVVVVMVKLYGWLPVLCWLWPTYGKSLASAIKYACAGLSPDLDFRVALTVNEPSK